MNNASKVGLSLLALVGVIVSALLVIPRIVPEEKLGFDNLEVAGGITGSGTTNQVTYFDSASTVAGDGSLTIDAGTDTVTVTNLTVAGTCTGCTAAGGVTTGDTLEAGDVIVGVSASAVGRVAGFSLDTAAARLILPSNYTVSSTLASFVDVTSTRLMSVASGTAASPSLRWGTDMDSGFYSPGDNTLAMALAATRIIDCNFNGCGFGSGNAAPVNSAIGLFTNGVYFTNATGTIINLLTGGNIKVNEANPRKTLTLSAAGGWPTATQGATTSTKVEVSSGLNFYASGFQPSTSNHQQWNVPMPDGYDGGTMTCSFYLTATSSPSFTGGCFGIRGVAVNDSSLLTTTFGASSTEVCVSHNWAANTQRVSSSTTVTIGNTPTGASNIWLDVFRNTDNASDTATNTLGLLNVECDYGVSTFSD